MPPDDDGDDPAPAFGPPLPLDDRLWRHPSELGAVERGLSEPGAPVLVGVDPDRRGSRLWTVGLAAGLAGAALTVSAVAVAGWGEKVKERPVVERVAARPYVADISTNAATGNGSSDSGTAPGAATSNGNGNSTPARKPTDSAATGVVAAARSVAPAIARLEVTTAAGSTTGSGVLFRDDGYLMTEAHVVQGARSIVAVLDDGSRLDAALTGTDKWTDIAVLKLAAGRTMMVATLAPTSGLSAGQAAVVVGSPSTAGAGPSITVGVVGAVGQQAQSRSGVALHGLVRTDITLPAGGAGGALVDGDGNVVGVVATMLAPSDDPGAGSVAFAVPIDDARSVAEQIVATGSAHHVWLGIEGDDLSDDTAKDLGLDGGATVSRVLTGGPAQTAGLEADDVITSVDGTPVASMSNLVLALREHHPGDQVTLTVIRDGSRRTTTVTLAEKDEP